MKHLIRKGTLWIEKSSKALLLLVVLSVVFQFSSIGQNNYTFKQFRSSDGLASNWVLDITQDQNGFIWFATSDGLSKFDGYTFTNFKYKGNDNAYVQQNHFLSIQNDAKRNCLWVSTHSCILRFDLSTRKFKRYEITEVTNFKEGPRKKGNLFLDSRGTVWCSGIDKHLYNYSEETDSFKRVRSNAISTLARTNVIREDNSGKLILGTMTGLFRYDSVNDQLEEIHSKKINFHAVKDVYVDDENKIWVGTSSSSTIYVCSGNEVIHSIVSEGMDKEFNSISSIEGVNRHSVFVSYRNKGIMEVDRQTFKIKFLHSDLDAKDWSVSKNPLIIFKDRFENVWVGTYNKGVSFIDQSRKKFHQLQSSNAKSSLLGNNVRSFYQDSEGCVWVGTKEGGGLSKFNLENQSFVNYKANDKKRAWLGNDDVLCLSEFSDKKIVVGTYGDGLFLFDKQKERFRKLRYDEGYRRQNVFVYALLKDSDGLLWIGGNTSLDVYNRQDKSFKRLGSQLFVRSFLETEDYVLVGTRFRGLMLYNKKKGVLEDYEFKHPTLKNITRIEVKSLSRDLNGDIWMASTAGLLFLKQDFSSEKLYTMENGLLDNNICSVEVDDQNNVWVGSKKGLSKLDGISKEVINYNHADGLQLEGFEDYVSLKLNNGQLLFGGTMGFNAFNPLFITKNRRIPQVLITDFNFLNLSEKEKALGKEVHLADCTDASIEIQYFQSSFVIDFVAINFTSSEKNRYRYKLEGYDDYWREADELRNAEYTKLPAGKYNFRVIASNNDGIWNNEGASMSIKILPPWWLTKWAVLLYIILFCVVVYACYKAIQYNVHQKNRILSEALENERLEELNTSRLTFFTNISHELRTPLTLLVSPLGKLSSSSVGDKALDQTLSLMNRNAQRLLRLVNQLMDFRRIEEKSLVLQPQKTDLYHLLSSVYTDFKYIANSKSLSLDLDVQIPNAVDCFCDGEKIENCLYNLLSNAIKFTPEGGRIQIIAKIENLNLFVQVVDSGVGIPSATLNNVFDRFYSTRFSNMNNSGAGIGLSYTKSLVELHNGTITVESEEGKGCCFQMCIPISADSYSQYNVTSFESNVSVLEKSRSDEPLQENSSEIRTNLENKNEEKLLIVEDDVDLISFLRSSFSNYKVVLAANGEEGFRLAKEEMPDLIISDVMMPIMDGLELCDALKNNDITSHIPVVLLTARTTVEQKLEGMRHQADAYIEKPFHVDLLSLQVSNLLQLRRNMCNRFQDSDFKTIQSVQLSPLDNAFIVRAKEIVDSNISDPNLSVESLSEKIGMSRSQLFRKFKVLCDTTPSKFIRIQKFNKATSLLVKQAYNVNEVATMVGFEDSSHFISSFKKHFGETPKQYADSRRSKASSEDFVEY